MRVSVCLLKLGVVGQAPPGCGARAGRRRRLESWRLRPHTSPK